MSKTKVGKLYRITQKKPTKYIGRILKIGDNFVTVELEYPVLTMSGFKKIVDFDIKMYGFELITDKEAK